MRGVLLLLLLLLLSGVAWVCGVDTTARQGDSKRMVIERETLVGSFIRSISRSRASLAHVLLHD